MATQIDDITLSVKADGLEISSDGIQPKVLHPLWLRERSCSAADFDQLNHQRLYEHADLSPNLRVADAVQENGSIRLSFSDGHTSEIDLEALTRELGWMDNPEAIPAAQSWDGGLSPLPEYDWASLDDPMTMRGALEDYFRHGFLIFQNTPHEPGALRKHARRFGFLRETNFGDLFDVETKPLASDLAYTDSALASHTDNPYRNPVPGIQYLHCLRNEVSGGLSTLVDGMRICETLEAENPDAMKVLESTQVRFRYQGPAGILEDYAPLIRRDRLGNIRHIRLSSRVDYVPALDHETLSLFYEGRRRLNQMANSPEYMISFPFRPGTLLMMDNYRLLHGRTAFDGKQGHRHLQGCYIDHDGPDGLYRTLANGGADTYVKRDDV